MYQGSIPCLRKRYNRAGAKWADTSVAPHGENIHFK